MSLSAFRHRVRRATSLDHETLRHALAYIDFVAARDARSGIAHQVRSH
jgi:hypothetical protein